MNAMDSDGGQLGLLTTIGYGDRPWSDFLARLRGHRIRYLIDVRSQPRSRQPEFNGDALKVLLGQAGITYVFMGDALGGKPDDPSCYVDGKVDYARCEARPVFSAGLERLMTALKGGHRVALMCSELDPERCHRSKLIGEALQRRNVPLLHIDRDGAEVTQQTVIGRLTGGQSALFGESFTSRDQVRETVGATVFLYEVNAPGGQPPFRYSDPYRKALRIHTKHIGTES